MARVLITANDMADAAGVNPKTFRQALRAANLSWHSHFSRWEAEVDSPEHEDMRRVLATLTRHK
jgi:hypothetical protein